MNGNEQFEEPCEEFAVTEAVYRMPYNELDRLVTYLQTLDRASLPPAVEADLERWEDFIVDNY